MIKILKYADLIAPSFIVKCPIQCILEMMSPCEFRSSQLAIFVIKTHCFGCF